MARSLAEKGLYQDAIRFYEPLQRVIDQLDSSCLSELARCYIAVGRNAEGEALHPSLLDFDGGDDDEDYSDSDSTAFEDDAGKKSRRAPVPASKLAKKSIEKESVNRGNLEELFVQRRSLRNRFQKDQLHLKDHWASITQRLVGSFMDEKAFFPDQKHHLFTGYNRQARHLAKRKLREKSPVTDIGKSTQSRICRTH